MERKVYDGLLDTEAKKEYATLRTPRVSESSETMDILFSIGIPLTDMDNLVFFGIQNNHGLRRNQTRVSAKKITALIKGLSSLVLKAQVVPVC